MGESPWRCASRRPGADAREPPVELKLTAAICTRNRSSWVRIAVASLLAQDLDATRLDILVVDNGSSDDTPSTLRSLAEQHDNVRWCVEPTPGLSRARNRAIAESVGDVIAFLDDDAEAAPAWARLHLDAYQDDDVIASGGPIVLDWPDRRPAWLPEEEESNYSGLDLGPAPCRFEPPGFPYGANMAIRRSVFDAVGLFALELGRRGNNLVSGEEQDLFDRMRGMGSIVYLPEASVVHHVLPDRTSRSWLLRRLYYEGRSTVIFDEAHARRSRAYWIGRAGWQVLWGVRHGAAAMGRAVRSRPPTDVMRSTVKAVHAAGTARESLRVGVRGQATERELAR